MVNMVLGKLAVAALENEISEPCSLIMGIVPFGRTMVVASLLSGVPLQNVSLTPLVAESHLKLGKESPFVGCKKFKRETT